MAELSLTFFDVGWGDSILLEAVDADGHHFGLIDSSDTTKWPTSLGYLKRHFERVAERATLPDPVFEFVVATHAHADHISGLQGVMRQFGARALLTSRFNSLAAANLLRAAARRRPLRGPAAHRHEYLDQTSRLTLGPISIEVLWPPAPGGGATSTTPHDLRDENNNSLVLMLELESVRMVLTGDCIAQNWSRSAATGAWQILLPSGLKLLQLPHHGAENGLFDGSRGSPLLAQLRGLSFHDSTVEPLIAVSCHPRPFSHPHQRVQAFLSRLPGGSGFRTCVPGTHWLRTDRNLNFTIWTDGTDVEVRARPPS